MDALILALALGGLIIAERFPSLRYQRLPILRPFFVSDAFYLLTGGVLLAYAMRALATPFLGTVPAVAMASLYRAPLWIQAALATVLYDLAEYATHVLLHRVAALWEVHKVHHSSVRLDWLATYRAHVMEHALRHLAAPVVLILLGFPLAAVALASAIYAAWAALGHSNLGLRLRVLEPLLISPRLHRMHHVPASSERNFGTIFSLWDRALGTLHADARAALAPTGVPDEIATYPQTWPAQLVEPFRRTGARRPPASPRSR